MNIEM